MFHLFYVESPERKNGRLDLDWSADSSRPPSPVLPPNVSLVSHPVAPAANSTMLSRTSELGVGVGAGVGVRLTPPAPTSTASSDIIPALGCSRLDALAARIRRLAEERISRPNAEEVDDDEEARTPRATFRSPAPVAPAPPPAAAPDLLRTPTGRRKESGKKRTTTNKGNTGRTTPRGQSRKRAPAQPTSSPRDCYSYSTSSDNFLYTLFIEGAKSRPDSVDLSTTIEAAVHNYGHRYSIESDSLK